MWPIGFNPVLGFLSVATRRTTSSSGGSASFNPVLGFLSVATFGVGAVDHARFVFQSRAGFSLRRDREDAAASLREQTVSIPCWVFSPSRPSSRSHSSNTHGFKPVLGFLSVATRAVTGAIGGEFGFNPVLGFLSVATGHSRENDGGGEKFQSRAGFSLRRDVSVIMSPVPDSYGFNPVLGFLSVATPVVRSIDLLTVCFNPVLGFLSVATDDRVFCATHLLMFQSRAGFSLRRDLFGPQRGCCHAQVSIPCWVFSPSRPSPVLITSVCILFQSRAGFSLRRDFIKKILRVDYG